MPGKRRSICTDLAIVDSRGVVELAAEFKCEPAHTRGDIWPSKFPVVFWGDEGVKGDIKRVKKFVAQKRTKVAYSLFIDEAGYFRHREPPEGSEWIDWGGSVVPAHHIWVLLSVARANL